MNPGTAMWDAGIQSVGQIAALVLSFLISEENGCSMKRDLLKCVPVRSQTGS